MSKTTKEKAKKAPQVEEQVTPVHEAEKQMEPVETSTESQISTESLPVDESEKTTEETAKSRQAKVRGKKYLSAKKKVDPDKYYPLEEAVKLAQSTSFSKFNGKIEAHVTTIFRRKENCCFKRYYSKSD